MRYERGHFANDGVEANTCVHWKNRFNTKHGKQQQITTYILRQLCFGHAIMGSLSSSMAIVCGASTLTGGGGDGSRKRCKQGIKNGGVLPMRNKVVSRLVACMDGST
jgi:hypothetical protein